MKRKTWISFMVAFLLLFFVAGCASLDIRNSDFRITKMIPVKSSVEIAGKYEKKAEFFLYDRVYFYAELKNCTVRNDFINVSTGYRIFDMDGVVVFERVFPGYEGVVPIDWSKGQFWWAMIIPGHPMIDLAPEQYYEMEIELTDNYSGVTTKARAKFGVFKETKPI